MPPEETGAPDVFVPHACIEAASDPDAGSEATSIAIDPAHTNAQAKDVVSSPLALKWSAPLTGIMEYVVVLDGRVFLAERGVGTATVRALDVSDGGSVWGPIPAQAGTRLAAHAGRIIALAAGGEVRAFEASTGKELWKRDFISHTVGVNSQTSFFPPPVAGGGLAFLEGDSLNVIDEKTGATVWQGVEGQGSLHTPTAFADCTAFSGDSPDLVASNVTNGAAKWARHDLDLVRTSMISIHAGRVWVKSTNAFEPSVVLDVKTGATIGTFESSVPPAFHGNNAFFVKAGILRSSDLTDGGTNWEFSRVDGGHGGMITSASVAGAGQVFVANDQGQLFEIDEATGAQLSAVDLGAPPAVLTSFASMAIAANHLFVVTTDKRLLVF